MRHARIFYQKARGVSRPVTFLLIGLIIIGIFFGCTRIKDAAKGTARAISDSTRKAADAITPSGSAIKHQVALIGMDGQADNSWKGFGAKFGRTFSDLLGPCLQILLDETMAELMKSPPQRASGQIDGYSLAMIGRPRGINFFVIGRLSDVALESEKTGFWLWKDTRYKLRATLRLEIVDTSTASKALDESFWEEMVIDSLKYEELEAAPSIPLSEVAPILERLLQEAGRRTCEVLRAQPWRAFITSVDQNTLSISAGRASGLSEGELLDVIDQGRMVENKQGQRFLLPGSKIGEARIESLSMHQSVAVLSQPVPISTGASVRLK